MTTTTHYGLKKPAGSDFYDIADFNYNADTLDAALHEIDTGRGNGSVVVAQNITSSAWSSNATYPDYPYRATLTVTGMTADHVPEVIFDGTDADIAKLAPHCASYNGGVYIYATENVGPVIAQTVKGVKAL